MAARAWRIYCKGGSEADLHRHDEDGTGLGELQGSRHLGGCRQRKPFKWIIGGRQEIGLKMETGDCRSGGKASIRGASTAREDNSEHGSERMTVVALQLGGAMLVKIWFAAIGDLDVDGNEGVDEKGNNRSTAPYSDSSYIGVTWCH